MFDPKSCQHCQNCQQPIIGRGPQAKFCSHQCLLIHQAETRKAYRANRDGHLLTCEECGTAFYHRYKNRKRCSRECDANAKNRRRRAKNRYSDRQEVECESCGLPFMSTRYNQIYCSKSCQWHGLNSRRIDKQRKTEREPYVSPEMIQRRAEAIRKGWKDGINPIAGTIDDGRHTTPQPPEPKPEGHVSQAQQVKNRIEAGLYDSAIRIAAKWPRLGNARTDVMAGLEAIKFPEQVRARGEQPRQLILLAVVALQEHLKMN